MVSRIIQAIVEAGRRPAFNLELDAEAGRRGGPPLPRHAAYRQSPFAPGCAMWPAVRGQPRISGRPWWPKALACIGSDDRGALMPATGACWSCCSRAMAGGPVGLDTLAAGLGEDPITLKRCGTLFVCKLAFSLLRTPRVGWPRPRRPASRLAGGRA